MSFKLQRELMLEAKEAIAKIGSCLRKVLDLQTTDTI